MMERFDYSEDIKACIGRNREEIVRLGRELFQCPEPGFREVKSNEILTSFLFRNGIPVQNGLALTGLRADLGSGDGYHIALVADMDALLIKTGDRELAIHSCGHSVQTAVLAGVMKMLKESGLVDRLGGTVSFIAAPAEEFIDLEYRKELVREGKIRYLSGKQNLIADGVFDDIDCVISMHINGDSGTLFDVGSALAGFMVKRAVFTGQAAHSGAAPHLGRNALHGASLCMDAIAYMKDQFPKEAGLSLHPVLTSVSGGVNIIPDRAVLESYIRANTLDQLLEAGEKFDRCAIHCAKALGLECAIGNETGYMPLKQSDALNTVVLRQMKKLCGDDAIVRNVVSGASGDVGDLGYLLPTVQFGFSGVKGRIHSGDFAIADEENAYIRTAQVVLGTVCELLANPDLQVRNGDFAERKAYYLKRWLRQDSGR